ncbi:hypothetical protein REPUB_Repub04eG0016900 [Reevesia pubescens]
MNMKDPDNNKVVSDPHPRPRSLALNSWAMIIPHKKKQQRRPPEPAGALPFLGHLHLLGKNQLLHRTFSDMAEKFGSVFLVRLGIHQALVVSNWEVAKECFTTNDKVLSTRPKSLPVKLMGYDHIFIGFAPYGPYRRNMRRVAMVELLSSRRPELLKHVRDTEINCFIKESRLARTGLALI